VTQGVTGFRCRKFKDIVDAIHKIDEISPWECRRWAEENCEDKVVHKKFDEYLHNIEDLNFYKL
jgi:hypothetical protein